MNVLFFCRYPELRETKSGNVAIIAVVQRCFLPFFCRSSDVAKLVR